MSRSLTFCAMASACSSRLAADQAETVAVRRPQSIVGIRFLADIGNAFLETFLRFGQHFFGTVEVALHQVDLTQPI